MTAGINKTDNQKTARLFFAIQPSHKIQQALGNIAKNQALKWGGRYTRPENIHLTLLFLGNTDIDKIDVLNTAVSNIKTETFDLIIHEARFWKRNRIICAHADNYPPALFTLVDAIKNAVRNAGLEFDDRTFKPHITLVRKAARYIPADFQKPFKWHVEEWLLMQSKQTDRGVRYDILGRWPLH